MRTTKILVVDDEHLIRWSLEHNLRKQGYEVLTAGNGEDALALICEKQPEVVLLDINMPGMSGLEVLEKLKEHGEESIAIMITAHSGLEIAVNAMRMGAYDYIRKPFNFDEIAIVIKKALKHSALQHEVARLRRERKNIVPPTIIGNGEHMQQLFSMMGRVARTEASTVLIQGESGTGKELVAKWIHFKSSRASRPFVAINCAAVSSTLLESELFGHEKGAFTGAVSSKKGLLELANGGTVFLDEIGDMEFGMQAKLLRFLEDRTFRRVGGAKVVTVDVRIISATNKDIHKQVEGKQFRNDLYYRVKTIPILLPPLRERREDIMPLVNHFIEHFSNEFNKQVKGVSTTAEKQLVDYDWPGNIRELRNVVERAIILGNDDALLKITTKIPHAVSGSKLGFRLPPEGVCVENVEKDLVRQALELSDGNVSKASRLLNLGMYAFRYRLKKFGYL